MRPDTLLRVGGWAAIIAGVLRAAGSFASDVGGEVERQSLYFIIDFLLLVGVIAAYAQEHEVVGRGQEGSNGRRPRPVMSLRKRQLRSRRLA